MEKRYSSRGAKRNARKAPSNYKEDGGKGPAKKLLGDFEDVVTDQTNTEWDKEEETMGEKEGSHHEAASSEGRSVSVFDRLGAKLIEHDLWLKLEKTGDKKEKEKSKGSYRPTSPRRDRELSYHRNDRPPSPRRDCERSYHRNDRPPSPRRDRERSHRRDDRPPSPRRDRERSHHPHEFEPKDRKNKDHKNDQEESSAPKKTHSHHGSTGEKRAEDKEPKVGDYKLEELKKALDAINNEK